MRFRLAALGGTFDILHKGHVELLNLAFYLAEHVIIGVSSDEFARSRGKDIENSYEQRVKELEKVLERYKNRYSIVRLDDDFGPALDRNDIEALIVSKETEDKGKLLNRLRLEKGLNALEIIVLDMILAKNGKPISSSRIRKGEIDKEGNVKV